jgi:excisionase family DNA binding protein
VAERLGVSLYTARAMGRRGELPVTTLGRRVGVRESSLGRFLERRECGGR